MLIWGLFGLFELVANVTGFTSINELSKDQVSILLGATWLAIGMES